MNGLAVSIRPARREEIPEIVAMLADDALGAARETTDGSLSESYLEAFLAIEADINHQLIVAEADGEIAGCLQLSFLPGLTYTGGWRAQIEGVRVNRDHRGQGIGQRMIEWAIGRARGRNCVLVQLSTDKQRPDAMRFYERLGFSASHEGMKLRLRGRSGTVC